MNEFKGTPGPWDIEPLEVFGRGDREGTAHVVLWDEDREGYTFVAEGLSYDDEESVANARLIAAAPDLLKAILRLQTAYSDVSGEVQQYDYEAMVLAYDAIAKALGDSK